ncbi:MAG: type IV pilus biogenesis/stability protein PilW [bacterium]|nr:type IV pilus biogenesis/stability protein PilW [bacterium]
MKAWAVCLLGMLLAACVQEPVAGQHKMDPVASARDRVALASEYLRQGDNEKAQVQLKRALELDSSSPEAHHMMAVVLERDGNIKGADKEYRKALRLRDGYSQAHNNYGIFLFKNGRYKDAMPQFQASAEDLGYENRAQAFEGLGRSALKTGDMETAKHAFVRALKLDPNLAASTLGMGEVQYASGDYPEARISYKRYLKMTNDSAQTAQSLWLGIRLERRQGDANALASYELALKKLYPSSPEYKLYAESLQTGK